MQWPKAALNAIEKTPKIGGATTAKQKQLHVAGYLFELVYDLRLSVDPKNSESPGIWGVWPEELQVREGSAVGVSSIPRAPRSVLFAFTRGRAHVNVLLYCSS